MRKFAPGGMQGKQLGLPTEVGQCQRRKLWRLPAGQKLPLAFPSRSWAPTHTEILEKPLEPSQLRPDTRPTSAACQPESQASKHGPNNPTVGNIIIDFSHKPLTGPRLSKPYLSATSWANPLSTPRRKRTRKELVKTAGPLSPCPDPPAPPPPAPALAKWRSRNGANSQLHAAAAMEFSFEWALAPWAPGDDGATLAALKNKSFLGVVGFSWCVAGLMECRN